MSQRIGWLIGFVAVSYLVFLLSPILMPFVAAALLAYLGDPLVDKLETWKLPRTLAVSVVFLVISLLVLILLLVLIPQLEDQIRRLISKLPAYLQTLEAFLRPYLADWLGEGEKLFDPAMVQKSLAQYWGKAGGIVANIWQSIASSGVVLLGWLVNLVLIPVLTFYLLRDWDHLVAAVGDLIPRGNFALWKRLAVESDEVLSAFLRGQMLVMLALGIIYTTGLWLVGLDFALLIGMFAGIVSFVPYLGLILGILVAGIAVIFQTQGLGDLPWVVLVFVVGQLAEGMFLTPRLVGERIGLHPVAVIFAVMAGGQLYGFFGILLALPIAAVVTVLLRHVLTTYRRSELYNS